MSATTTLKRSYDTFVSEDENSRRLLHDYNMSCGAKPFCFGSSATLDFTSQQQGESSSSASSSSSLDADTIRQSMKKRRERLLYSKTQPKTTHTYVTREESKKPSVQEFISSYLKEKRKFLLQHFPDQKSNIDFNQNTFTMEEVEQLLKVRDEQNYQEMNEKIQEKLSEQYELFTKFNHDYISKQFKETDFSYTS
ncbi:hypothetical protein FDP41_011080 [Naegleria fowleri]|uniref:Uncharacterized protein n=1 Tax=Naegleria fowleri TaxID=5763 RepID=A0A6A5C860_NAEFO|nr:uncharacterized protein FDP41_011080 [Naegleria fowleri]KAF0983102.1 hypothetical protein FDP41_011080 [Naegleria fowleri]CAG4713929.1 unnamed protein product [Naegleria fowleri]